MNSAPIVPVAHTHKAPKKSRTKPELADKLQFLYQNMGAKDFAKHGQNLATASFAQKARTGPLHNEHAPNTKFEVDYHGNARETVNLAEAQNLARAGSKVLSQSRASDASHARAGAQHGGHATHHGQITHQARTQHEEHVSHHAKNSRRNIHEFYQKGCFGVSK